MNRKYFLILLLGIGLAGRASGLRFIKQNQFELSSDACVDEEIWLWADQRILLEGVLRQDIVATANDVDLGGSFEGDVFALGRIIRFTGFGRDNLRLAGQTILLKGRAERNVLALASSIEADSSARFMQDAVLIANQVIFKGEARNLYIVAKEVSLSGVISGRVRISADDIVILPGTQIGGDLVYTSPAELVLDSRVIVSGHVLRSLTPPGGFQQQQPTFQSTVSWSMFLYGGAWVAGLAFAALFPVVTGLAVQALRQRPGWCGLIGIIALGMLPMAGFILLLTMIGIPLGILLLTAGIAFGYLAKLPVALLLGSLLLRLRGPTPFRSVAGALSIGLFILYGAALVPYISPVVTGTTLIFGLGSLLTAVFARGRGRGVGFVSPPAPLPTGSPSLSSEEKQSRWSEMKED